MEVLPIEIFGVAVDVPFAAPIGYHSAKLDEFAAKICDQQTGLSLRPDQIHLRKVDDLFPNFKIATKHNVPEASLSDSDSNSLWSISGKALTGDLKDRQLREITVEDNLYWGPMKYWYPELVLLQ